MTTVFQKLSAKYGLNESGYGDGHELLEDNVPCFVDRAQLRGRGFEVKDMVPYLKACARETIGVMVLSTTEREDLHKEWLKAAEEVGATITKGKSVRHGGYAVWLIALTGKKRQ